jgi:hypothetical protein
MGMPMTEPQWLACADPAPMLEFLRGKASDRKLRLFACGCCRRVWQLLACEESRKAVEAAEGYAGGGLGEKELALAAYAARLAWAFARRHHQECAASAAYAAALLAQQEGFTQAADAALDAASGNWNYAHAWDDWQAARKAEGHEQARLLRDLIVLCAAPALTASVLAWNDRTVPRLAQAVYDERAFGRLPILADALLDAGCEDEALIQHCRSPGPHVRGCWAVDLIMGKS